MVGLRHIRIGIFVFFVVLAGTDLRATTVQEVARELECPCDCPLILEDCNMSCGLDWKEQIGEQIRAGKTKEEIIQWFVDQYGDACRITPVKRIKGKIYQYTRGFDTKDWVILWGGIAIWGAVVVGGIILITRRWFKR